MIEYIASDESGELVAFAWSVDWRGQSGIDDAYDQIEKKVGDTDQQITVTEWVEKTARWQRSGEIR